MNGDSDENNITAHGRKIRNGTYKDKEVLSVLNSGEAVGSVPFSNEPITFLLQKMHMHISRGTYINADKMGRKSHLSCVDFDLLDGDCRPDWRRGK